MSRIYDALQTAEATRLKNGAAEFDGLGVMTMPQQRHSVRQVALAVPLTVYGRTPGGSPFYKDAEAMSGSADGGLIVLSAPVREGQDLLLINNHTSQEQMCRVIHFRSRDAETNEVSVAFTSPNREFWIVPESPFKRHVKSLDEAF